MSMCHDSYICGLQKAFIWTLYCHCISSGNKLRPVGLRSGCDVNVGLTYFNALQGAHSKLVAAVLWHRLAMHGQALICCAVRDQVSFYQLWFA